jgi:hypothetical protein
MRITHVVVGLVILAAAVPSLADDLTGSTAFLCTAVQATACETSGECATKPPWTLNVPQFIEVDLDKEELRTTRASGQNRATPVKRVERADGMIYLQGAEGGRAFSFAINESTGMLTVAVATGGKGVIVFGACTPLAGSR